jgi:hypothetical protein
VDSGVDIDINSLVGLSDPFNPRSYITGLLMTRPLPPPRPPICQALRRLPEGSRARLGADIAAFDGLGGRAGAGISIDRSGQVWLDLNAGVGYGRGALASVGPSYVINAPTQSQISITGNAGYGTGYGASVQTGYGSQTGYSNSGNIGYGPVAILPGKVGVEASVTVNAEAVVPIISIC